MLYKYDGQLLADFINYVYGNQVFELARQSLDSIITICDQTHFHININPENLLVRAGSVVIIDFGITEGTHEKMVELTDCFENERFCYNIVYCPTEVLRGNLEQIYLEKVDVYCWGMTIYQLITRKSLLELKAENEKYKTDKRRYANFLRNVSQIKFLNDPNDFIGQFLVKLLLEILHEDPIQRPTFKEIREEFTKIKINDKLEYAKMLKIGSADV